MDVFVYEYDEKELVSYTGYDSMGSIISKTEKHRDEKGKLIPIVFNTDMKLECKNYDKEFCVKCSVDKFGNVIFFERKDKYGRLFEKYKFKYSLVN